MAKRKDKLMPEIKGTSISTKPGAMKPAKPGNPVRKGKPVARGKKALGGVSF
jgi:hypothetical protein